MKKHFHAATLLVAALIASACSGDADENSPQFDEENPLPEFLITTEFDQDQIAYIDDNNNYEMGFGFKPAVTGKINALVIKIPDVRDDVRVTIWDVATATPIHTELIDVPQAAVNTTKNITPILLEQGKEYTITMNSSDYYFRYKANNPDPPTYPIPIGNIVFTASYCDMGPQQIMPTVGGVNSYFGDVSFVFEQTQ
jgi:hypothetical protein